MLMEKFYTIGELEEILKLSDTTIRRYIRAGKLESTKIGRYHRISESSIKAFLDEQNNTTNDERSALDNA